MRIIRLLFILLVIFTTGISAQNVVKSGDNNNKNIRYELNQNYPNPFNPTTTIKFTIPKESHVVLKVYNTLGQEVKTLINEFKEAGTYSVNFSGENLLTGMYFYRLEAGGFTQVKKMTLLK